MKYFKYLQFFIAASAALIFFSCSKEGHYTLTETPPLDFRSYYNGLTVTLANATEGATNISWDFGDTTNVVQGDSVEHTYQYIGNYVITMNGTVEGKSYVFHTMLRVDKASVVNLEDGSFDDWKGVVYPDFMLSGLGAVDTAKIDYDANKIYVYVEFDSVATNAGIIDHMFALYMDVDNSVATGFSMKEMGVDYGCEGNIYTDYVAPSIVDMVNGDPSWPFMEYPVENAISPGYIIKEGDRIKMEFGISREVFKITSDVFSIAISIMDSEWSDVGYVVTPLPDFSEKITVRMDKTSKK
jgi:hypothetical protein